MTTASQITSQVLPRFHVHKSGSPFSVHLPPVGHGDRGGVRDRPSDRRTVSRTLTDATGRGDSGALAKVTHDLMQLPFVPRGVVIKIDDASTSVEKAGKVIVDAYRTTLLPEFRSRPRGQVALLEMRVNSCVDLLHPGLIDVVDAHEPTVAEYRRKQCDAKGVLDIGSPLSDALWLEAELGMKLRLQGYVGPIACMLTADGSNNSTLGHLLKLPESEQRAGASMALARKFGIRIQFFGFVPHNSRAELERFIKAVGLIRDETDPDRNEVNVCYYDPRAEGAQEQSVTTAIHDQVKFLRRTI